MKKISMILIILGFILLVFGISSFSFGKDSDNSNKNELVDDGNKDDNLQKDNLVVNTSLISGDEINNTMYDYYKVNKLVSDEIKSQDLSKKNKYMFSYSNDYNNVIVGDNSVRANGVKTSFAASMMPTSYNLSVDYFKSYYKRLGFDLCQIYESDGNIKISDYSVKYIKIIAKKSNNNSLDNYREQFVIIIEESDDYRFVIRYEIIDSRFTDDILTNFLKQVKIEKSSAKYLYTSIKDGKVNGSLKQNAELDDSSVIYEVLYNLDSNKYVEVENGSNSINYNSISLKSNPNMNIFLKTKVYGNDGKREFLDESVATVNEKITNSKIIDSSVSDISINGKTFLKSSVVFLVDDNKTMYETSVAYKIGDNVYYVVNVISDSNISDSIFDDFTDVTYKKV